MSTTAHGPSVLPPLTAAPNERTSHERPDGVVGRMKPTKARKVLREIAASVDDPETERIRSELDRDLADARR